MKYSEGIVIAIVGITRNMRRNEISMLHSRPVPFDITYQLYFLLTYVSRVSSTLS